MLQVEYLQYQNCVSAGNLIIDRFEILPYISEVTAQNLKRI
jgi:hypothetical protein